MSKLTEYIKLIPRGIKDLDKVIQGIRNDVKLEAGTLPQHMQDIIIGRRLICSTCPYLSKNAKTSEEYLQLTGKHYETDRTEDHCSMCGCPINIRTATMTKDCGLEVWNFEQSDNQPLKWKAE